MRDRIHAVVAAAATIVLLTSCGSGSAGSSSDGVSSPGGDASDDELTGDTSGWPFADETAAPAEFDPVPPDPATEPRDGEALPEVAASGGPDGEIASEEQIEELDPCSLITVEEWASWRGVDASTAEQVPLEYGDACGWRDADDTVRLALALIESAGGSWLPEDVPAEAVDVDGRTARWAVGYPVDVSSVLVVELDAAELILEMSALGDAADDSLLAGAVELATIAVGRWQG